MYIYSHESFEVSAGLVPGKKWLLLRMQISWRISGGSCSRVDNVGRFSLFLGFGSLLRRFVGLAGASISLSGTLVVLPLLLGCPSDFEGIVILTDNSVSSDKNTVEIPTTTVCTGRVSGGSMESQQPDILITTSSTGNNVVSRSLVFLETDR